jgi:hypothetical protein
MALIVVISGWGITAVDEVDLFRWEVGKIER